MLWLPFVRVGDGARFCSGLNPFAGELRPSNIWGYIELCLTCEPYCRFHSAVTDMAILIHLAITIIERLKLPLNRVKSRSTNTQVPRTGNPYSDDKVCTITLVHTCSISGDNTVSIIRNRSHTITSNRFSNIHGRCYVFWPDEEAEWVKRHLPFGRWRDSDLAGSNPCRVKPMP